MNIAVDTPLENYPLTRELASWSAGVRSADISSSARLWARHALLDWFGVTLAAKSEPLVDMLVDDLKQEGQTTGPCTIVAHGLRSSTGGAALVNGAASHALDYDDVNRRMMGHPTVPVAPLILALAERGGLSGSDVLTALVVGTEIECLIGQMAGLGHYDLGFHNTATIGTFGAAAAAAWMLQLDAGQTARCLGIAASQAAGLKSNFGTMTKPLHAGKSAANGLFAARLAKRGFSANESALECPQGFAAVCMPGFTPGATAPEPEGSFAIEQTLFKYHAACYLTHASIEAVTALRDAHGIALDDMKSMTLQVMPDNFKVCNIDNPTTGLEIKFSIRHCVVMALDGVDTAALDSYSDANATASRYAAARARTQARANPDMDRMGAHVRMELNDGRVVEAQHDAGVSATDTAVQWQRLGNKFMALATPVIGDVRARQVITAIENLDHAGDIRALMAAVA